MSETSTIDKEQLFFFGPVKVKYLSQSQF